MKHLKIVEQIPSVDVLKTMEKPYVLLEEGTNNLQYNYVEPPIQYTNGNAGDIVFKTAEGSFKAVKPKDWSADLGTAVGVCVIPTNHNVYGDGSCAILSLSQATSKEWGGYGTDIDGLDNKTMIGCVGHDEDGNWIPTNEIDHSNTYGFICSDKFNEVPNPFDEGTAWNYNDSDCHIASPYNNDGSRNAVYYQTTSPLTAANATADFDGINNTTKMIPILEILIETEIAAQVVSTLGTEGDGLTWYLPACGELAYIMPRFNKINEGLSKVGTPMGEDVAFWSSSEVNSDSAWCVGTHNGGVFSGDDYGAKDGEYSVLGFARVSLSV